MLKIIISLAISGITLNIGITSTLLYAYILITLICFIQSASIVSFVGSFMSNTIKTGQSLAEIKLIDKLVKNNNLLNNIHSLLTYVSLIFIFGGLSIFNYDMLPVYMFFVCMLVQTIMNCIHILYKDHYMLIDLLYKKRNG